MKNWRLTEQSHRNRLIFLQRTCVACVGSEFYYELSRYKNKQRNQRSHRVRFPWLFKQTGIAGLRAPPRVMNNRDSLHGPFCSLFSPVPRPVSVGEATDFNPAWICRGSESTWTRPFRQYISLALSDGAIIITGQSPYRRFVIIINSAKVRAISFNDARNYCR